MARRGKTTTYGERGGTGPTAGRKLVYFEAIGPDGIGRRKGTYFAAKIIDPVMCFYQHKGVWHVAAVCNRDDPHLAHYTQVVATRAPAGTKATDE
jgi:hypothetical protein